MAKPGDDKPRLIRGWKAIARLLGVSVRTAQRWAQKRGLPLWQKGGIIFAEREVLGRWLRAGGERRTRR